MTTILDTLILFSINPFGFMIVMSLLIFFEYLILKSVIQDIKIALSYIKNLKPKIIPAASFLPKTLDVIFKKKNIVIKEAFTINNTKINYIKINEWVN
jgi:hypothetical protein